MTAKKVIDELKNIANPELAEHHKRFFKTGRGEYGEGDIFLGIKVPEVREIAKKHYKNIDLSEIEKLIKHPYHEIRLCALVILILKFQKADEQEQKNIYELYIKSVNYINNWDLVDISAGNIVGAYLFGKNTDEIWKLANSGHLWSERIAVISTFYFIKNGDYSLTKELCRHFLSHKHDLMHKATGWMLREAGKKEINALYEFLDEHYKLMPRTMLRYAIERLPDAKRAYYMGK